MTDDERITLPPARETQIPSAAPLPRDTLRADPIASLSDRVGDLSDALHDPDGLIHRLFAAAEERAAARHCQLLQVLGHVSNQVVELTAIVNKLAPEQERQAAKLKLIQSPVRRKRSAPAAE